MNTEKKLNLKRRIVFVAAMLGMIGAVTACNPNQPDRRSSEGTGTSGESSNVGGGTMGGDEQPGVMATPTNGAENTDGM